MNFTQKVRESAKFIYENSDHVSVDESKMEEFAEWLN